MRGSFLRPVRTISAVMLLAAVLAAAKPADSVSQTTDSKVVPGGTAELERVMTFYYRAPSDVVTLLKQWERLKPPQNRAMIGFLAGLFAKNPAVITSVTSIAFEMPTQAMIVLALSLADREHEAKRAATAWGWPPNQVASIPKYPPLINVKAERPETSDTLWAASFATGDARYVRPIYEYYAAAAEQSDIDMRDIAAIVVAKHRREHSVMEALATKYPRDKLTRVIYASSALWSLESNGRQHRFVAQALERYAQEQPDSRATAGLKEVRAALGAHSSQPPRPQPR